MAGFSRTSNPFDLIFDVSVSKHRYVLRGLFLAIAGLLAAKPTGLTDSRAAGSVSTLFSTVLLLPLVQNAIYIFPVDLVAGRSRARLRISIAAALLASLVYAVHSADAAFLFGSYFIFAAVYLAWRETDRSFGFWFGVVLHAIFNLPAAAVAFLA